jgi:hypothetical protein
MRTLSRHRFLLLAALVGAAAVGSVVALGADLLRHEWIETGDWESRRGLRVVP